MTYDIKYRKDEEMKDSGIEWLGKVPREWYDSRIKNHFRYEKGKRAQTLTKEYIRINTGQYPVYSGQTEDNGIMGCIRDYDYDLKKCIFTTTVGANVMTPMLLKGKFSLSQNCLLMIGNDDVDDSFVYYWLNPLFKFEKSLIPSYMQPSLRMEDLNRYRIYLPPNKDQQKISNFLDIKTAEFDSIISKKEQLIEKLEDAKKSLISEVVTGKVNIVDGKLINRKPEEMRDSGVEWLGMIPNDWEIKKLKHIVSEPLKYGANESGDDENPDNPRYIRITDFGEDGKLKDDTFKSLDPIKAGDYMLKEGDILFARSGATVGKTFQFKDFSGNACFAGYLIKATPNCKVVNSDYLYYFTKTYGYENWKNSIFIQATIQNIGADKYKELQLCTPNVNEQNVVCNYLDERTKQINSIMTKTQQQITKLKQAKQSLISEVVTGKIDLRDWEIIDTGGM